MFGTRFVGAIHGRLLTAWSTAGILGPVLVNYIREYQIDHGIPPYQAYNTTMYVLAALLLVGLLCNLLVRPVDAKYFMTEAELEAERTRVFDVPMVPAPSRARRRPSKAIRHGSLAAWMLVGIPLAWGVWNTVVKAAGLFRYGFNDRVIWRGLFPFEKGDQGGFGSLPHTKKSPCPLCQRGELRR